MINAQTLAQLLSALGPSPASLMGSPSTAAAPSAAGPQLGGGAPGAQAAGAPNLASIIQGAQAVRPQGGGMFGPMMQPPSQGAPGGAAAAGGAGTGGGAGGMSPLLLAALMQQNRSSGNPGGLGALFSGNGYNSLMGGSLGTTLGLGPGTSWAGMAAPGAGQVLPM